MANILASAIVDAAEEILQDSANDRWSAVELLAWLNMGSRAIVREKPDAYPVRETVLLSSGIWQSLPTNAIMLLDAIANKGLTDATGARNLTVAYASIGSEKITNGSMETDANWNSVGTPSTQARSSTYAHGGTYSRKFVCDASAEGIKSDAYTSVISTMYFYRLWVYPSVTTIGIAFTKGDNSGDISAGNSTVVANQWNCIQGCYIETAGGANAVIKITAANGATVYVDDVTVTPITTPLNTVPSITSYDAVSSPVTVVSRKWLDAALPTWTTVTASPTVKHVIYDPQTNPKTYGVYPQNDGAGYLEIVTAKLPTDVAIGASILLGDEYAEALVDYLCFRAFSRDADYSTNAERAMAHYQNFMMMLGKLDANEALLNPKRKHGVEQ